VGGAASDDWCHIGRKSVENLQACETVVNFALRHQQQLLHSVLQSINCSDKVNRIKWQSKLRKNWILSYSPMWTSSMAYCHSLLFLDISPPIRNSSLVNIWPNTLPPSVSWSSSYPCTLRLTVEYFLHCPDIISSIDMTSPIQSSHSCDVPMSISSHKVPVIHSCVVRIN